MVKAIQVHSPGSFEELKFEKIVLPDLTPEDVKIRHTAIGINFIDTYFRSGLYAWPHDGPIIPGAEAAGIVEEIGSSVTNLEVGDRVAYTTRMGAYSEERVINQEYLIKIPSNVEDKTAAATMLKGLTVHYLFNRTFQVKPEHTLLFHAAAGGVGSIAGQWASQIGATIIGTAGSEEKVKKARANGYNHVINYNEENFVERVMEITDGKGVDVVYDSVGKDTYPHSLDTIKRLGMWVCFGQSSGIISDFKLAHLAQKGSLFATRPSLFNYIKTRQELEVGANEMFSLLGEKKLKISINQEYQLQDASKAHYDLENRLTTGSSILLV